jgi:hypothetical protein
MPPHILPSVDDRFEVLEELGKQHMVSNLTRVRFEVKMVEGLKHVTVLTASKLVP